MFWWYDLFFFCVVLFRGRTCSFVSFLMVDTCLCFSVFFFWYDLQGFGVSLWYDLLCLIVFSCGMTLEFVLGFKR